MLKTNMLIKNEVKRDFSEVRNDFRGNSQVVIERGDIFWAELQGTGSVQSGLRPVIAVANWACLKYSPVITVVPVTSKLHKKSLPVHVQIGTDCGLKTDSIVLCEGITSINKSDLRSKIGHCTEKEMADIEKGIQIQNGIEIIENKNTKYYSTSEKFETEVFDIYKAKKISKNIVELERFIDKYDNPEVNPVKESLQTLISELRAYCLKFNKNISLFYKPTINNCETKNYKGVVAIG